jgi:hypothetical protein
MAQKDPNGTFLEKVDPSRRQFFGRLIGTGFAAPLIATFSIDALSIESAAAFQTSNACNVGHGGPDMGYVGPAHFKARLVDSSSQSRLQGNVVFNLDTRHNLRQLTTHLTVSRDATVLEASVRVNGTPVATFPDGKGVIATVLCFADFDGFLEALADKQATISVTAVYAGVTHTLTGPLEPQGGQIVNLPPQ